MSAKSKEPPSSSNWYGKLKARNTVIGAVPGVPLDLVHGTDEFGSLITPEPADWMICFVRGLQKQWWHKFVDKSHKHVFAMRPTESGSWVLVEPWWSRLLVTILPSADAVRYLRWGATGDILRVKELVPGKGNQVRGWSNCAVLTAFVLGRQSRSWTPNGLYEELMQDKSVEKQNVEDLLVEQNEKVVGRNAADALRLDPVSLNGSVDSTLTALGRNLLTTMMSPAVSQLCHSAIVEAERYPRASRVYHEKGLKPAVAAVAKILEAAQARGEVDIGDSQIAAGQFIAMLRGNLHLQEVVELKKAPSSAEVEARVRSTVNTFLHGVEVVT